MDNLRRVFDFCDQARTDDIKQWSEKLLDSVIAAGKRNEDNFHVTIGQLKENHISLASHRNCVSTYSSSTLIDRSLKKRRQQEQEGQEQTSSKKLCRPAQKQFDFKRNCLFCGEECKEKDNRHPDCWRKFYVIRTVYTRSWTPFKNYI